MLDVIVEEDCSESVILAEMMDNVDMSMNMHDSKLGSLSAREERTSMMIHRQDLKPRFGAQAPVEVRQAPPPAG